MNELLKETSDRLLQVIAEAKDHIIAISESEWSVKVAPEKWSRKEMLGHLVDSAANNHIRFVRAQLADDVFTGDAYEQNFFVTAQKYAEANTQELIQLWYSYNRHLASVIRHINPDKLNVSCHIGPYEPAPLSFVVTDYVTHLEHHLSQIYAT